MSPEDDFGIEDRVEEYEAEIADLQADLKIARDALELRTRGFSHWFDKCQKAEAEVVVLTSERNAVQAEVARLRKALTELIPHLWDREPHYDENLWRPEKRDALQRARAALEGKDGSENCD